MFNNIGKGGSSDGALHDDVQATKISLAETDLWVEEVEAAVKSLQNQQTPAASEPVNTDAIWTCMADLKQGMIELKAHQDGLQVPDITPVLDRLADLHTRLQFAERNRGVSVSELEACVMAAESRLRVNHQTALSRVHDHARLKAEEFKNICDHQLKLAIASRRNLKYTIAGFTVLTAYTIFNAFMVYLP